MMRRDLLRWEAELMSSFRGSHPGRSIADAWRALSLGWKELERRDEGVMGRQRAEESLNSFNAAPPLSDARLSPLLGGHLCRPRWFPVSRK